MIYYGFIFPLYVDKNNIIAFYVFIQFNKTLILKIYIIFRYSFHLNLVAPTIEVQDVLLRKLVNLWLIWTTRTGNALQAVIRL